MHSTSNYKFRENALQYNKVRDYSRQTIQIKPHSSQFNQSRNYNEESSSPLHGQKPYQYNPKFNHVNKSESFQHFPIKKSCTETGNNTSMYFTKNVPQPNVSHNMSVTEEIMDCDVKNKVKVVNKFVNFNARENLNQSTVSNQDNNTDNKNKMIENRNNYARCFSGSVEKVMKWHKLLANSLYIYEVIGQLVSVREGPIRLQRIILMRSSAEKGPILQIMYYVNDRFNIHDFRIGEYLRCIGTMAGINILRTVSIRNAFQSDIQTVNRMQSICDRRVAKLIDY